MDEQVSPTKEKSTNVETSLSPGINHDSAMPPEKLRSRFLYMERGSYKVSISIVSGARV